MFSVTDARRRPLVIPNTDVLATVIRNTMQSNNEADGRQLDEARKALFRIDSSGQPSVRLMSSHLNVLAKEQLGQIAKSDDRDRSRSPMRYGFARLRLHFARSRLNS